MPRSGSRVRAPSPAPISQRFCRNVGVIRSLGVISRGRLSPGPQECRRSVLARRDHGRSPSIGSAISNRRTSFPSDDLGRGRPMEMTGMLGTSLAAAELTQQGFAVSMTSRNARDADVLVAHQDDKRAWSIQMKMNPASFWLLSKDDRKVSSATHIYLFVNLRGRQTGLRRCAEPRRDEAWRNDPCSKWRVHRARIFTARCRAKTPVIVRMRSVANSADRTHPTSSTHCRARLCRRNCRCRPTAE